MMQCSSCGATLRENQAVCGTCGVTAPPAKRKSKKIALIVIAAITVLALMALLFLLGLWFDWFAPRQPVIVYQTTTETTVAFTLRQSEDDDLRRQLGLPFTPARFYTTANLHLRAQPDAQAQSLVLVNIATQVRVLFYYSEDWFRVQYGDEVGYMAAGFLSTTQRVNIASPVILNADRATLEHVFGRGAAAEARDNGDGTSSHDILYENVTVRVVTWRENGQDMFRVHSISVNFRNTERQPFHLHGVDNTTRRDGILEALGETVNAWHHRFDFRGGDTHMSVSFGNDRVHHMSIRVDFADHHFWEPEPQYYNYYWGH